MRKRNCYTLILFVLISFGSTDAAAQFSGPESVVFDSLRNRYLVSNYYSGEVLEMDTNGVTRPYFDDVVNSHGNHIDNDTMYLSVNGGRLLIFDLTTDSIVSEVFIPPILNLDGVCTDTSGYIYVIDTGGRVFRINKQTLTPELLVSGLPLYTQDCVFDPFNNRLIICCWTTSESIRSVDLNTGDVTILVNSGAPRLDGIAMDDRGNTYVASHSGAGYVYMFDSTFSTAPVIISSGHAEPAGLCYNVRDKILVIPNFGGNSVDFIADPFYLDDDTDNVINGLDNCPITYNPDQEDTDLDGSGDSCDVCPFVYDPDQADTDGDSVGDSCDVCPGYDDLSDFDGDTVPDSCDNCPYASNSGQEDADLNGVGDACDFICGDADGSGGIDIDDVVFLVGYIFAGGPAPEPLASGDADCSGGIDIDDAVYLIAYVFSGGPAPCDPDGDSIPNC